MRKLLISIVGLAVMGTVAFGGILDRERLTVTTRSDTNSTWQVAQTNTVVRGHIESIVFDIPAGVTGDVSLVVASESGIGDLTLAVSNSIAADARFIPRFDVTNPDGVALTGDEPVRFPMVGDSLVFSVTNATSTNVVFAAYVKYER